MSPYQGMTSPTNLTAEVAQRYLTALDEYLEYWSEDARNDTIHTQYIGVHPTPLFTATLTDLPVEIIGEIFLLVCAPPEPSQWWHWEHTSLRLPPPGAHPESPLKLGHICAYLRRAAWSTPMLWTYIDIYPTLTAIYTAAELHPNCPVRMHTNVAHQVVWLNDQFWATDGDGSPRCLVSETVYPGVEAAAAGAELLQEWIDRSQDLPLTVVFRRERSWPSLVRWNRFTAPLFRVLARVAHRWTSINAFVPYNCAALLESGIGGEGIEALKGLRTASLCAVVSSGQTAFAQVDAAFLRSARGLQRLQLCGFHQFSVDVADTAMKFAALTELRVGDTRASTLLALLQRTPALRTLVVRDVYNGQGEIVGVHFELKWLESLKLISCTSVVLEHIGRAPVLKDMKLVEITGVELDIQGVTGFLGRSGYSLATLELEAEKMHAPSIALIAQCVPLITTLIICLRDEDGEEIGEALGRLLSLNERRRHMPFLIHLEFHAKGRPFIGVIDAVKQRWQRGHLMEARDVPRCLEAVNVEIVSKIAFLGLRYENDDMAAVIRKCMREEMDAGLVLKFAKWKEIKTMQDVLAAFR